MKNKKVLIAVRNYEIPNLAVNYAVALSKSLERHALLVGVAKAPVVIGSTGIGGAELSHYEFKNMEMVKEKREIDLQAICLDAKNIWKHTDYDIEIGFPEATVVNKAEQEYPYLVAIEGDHELTTLGEWFGTYETRLAEDIYVPVLVVPKDLQWKPVREILYVMELDDNKAKSIRHIFELSKDLKANLHVMIIGPDSSKEQLEKYNHIVNTIQQFYDCDQARFSLATHVESADEIIKKTEQMQVDWLAFDHKESNFFERVFSNLNTERLILKAEIPVLVF